MNFIKRNYGFVVLFLVAWFVITYSQGMLQDQYTGITPQEQEALSFETTFPGWYVQSPDPNSEVRQVLRISELVGLPAMKVGTPFTMDNPFIPGEKIPFQLTGFEFKQGGYGVVMNPSRPFTEIYALVSWTKGPVPFLFVSQSLDVTQSEWDGFNLPDRTAVYNYGSIQDASGVTHQVALLRFAVTDQQDPVVAIFLLQADDPLATLWAFAGR